MQRDLASMLQQKSHLAALGLAVSKINHDLRNLLASAQLFSDRLAERARPERAALRAQADALARARDRVLPVDALLRPGEGAAARPQAGRARRRWSRTCARRSASRPTRAVRWITAVERGLLRRCRPDQLFRVILNLARNALQALESRAPNEPGRDQLRITGRREGAVVVIEVSDTGPGVSGPGARASVRGVPGLDPARRLRARPCDRGRAGARPWRRDPPGRRHHRRDLPHDHPGPRGRYRRPARRAGAGLNG